VLVQERIGLLGSRKFAATEVTSRQKRLVVIHFRPVSCWKKRLTRLRLACFLGGLRFLPLSAGSFDLNLPPLTMLWPPG
jgi:hypothetical protein